MAKRFNVTGTCYPFKHYMADISDKYVKTFEMMEIGEYFIINRPRQYGKTTMLQTITDTLSHSDEYVVFYISFEGIGDIIFDNEDVFSKGFVEVLATYAKYVIPDLAPWLDEAALRTNSIKTLSETITQLVLHAGKKIVLLIDEVDKSSNNQVFVSFLALLRDKYLKQNVIKTFHSVVLAGLHDVKTLKLKLRPEEEQKYNSPWNIAADFKVDMNLYPNEIKPMLDDYVAETGVTMDTQWVAERLFYYTSGYPFLVSKLCKTIAEDIVPDKTEKTWTDEDIETSVRLLMKEKNTNFDSLIKNLENNKALYNLVYQILMEGEVVSYNSDEPLVELGLMFGIFKQNGQIKIQNRIYEQRLYSYMEAKTTVAMLSKYDYANHFASNKDALDMSAVLLKFQQFMKEEYNEKDKTFLEQNGRLVFLSFLSPILNGKGHSFKEVQISEEKRLDIVATYNQYKYIIELKRWYGEVYHEKGIAQLAEYLHNQGVNTGFLVIFEYNKVKSWQHEWIERDGKRIFAVWV